MIAPIHQPWSETVSDFEQFFQEHAESGVHLDPDLCQNFAEMLEGVREAMSSIEIYVATLIQPEGRTSAERRQLVRAAEIVPGTNVVRLPMTTRAAPGRGSPAGDVA